jgi:hypothetical protein
MAEKRLHDYIPSYCKGDDRTFEGKITLRVPSAPERFRYLRLATNLNNSDDGQNLEAIAVMIEKLEYHIEKVDIKRLSDGKRYTSYDDLTYDTGANQLLIETSSWLLNGDQAEKKN